MTLNKLTPKEKTIIEDKGTETPFTGKYDDFFKDGKYICKKCDTPLFSSKAKFDAGCGWPNFDDEYPNSLKRVSDTDGVRTEIQCANCEAHLGHEFKGEHLTDKNLRHCVNSLSVKFIPR
ncbi:methionine sulfoxide reductase B [Candidatus Daviesbacteria bacterium RIFCSPLOWO2_02_FULL_36_8]|uniref:peptide-methionine (R)-S-oxide reductase n=1 Tax=Candidatus Daviesbacteria bacterium RIFCSPLOWO2_02_FULL_36_8 TaxID=1797793 RepID=A0A1F5MGP0_9BACT|nr:MAG: methionine sulfoxide reductase B [Candidatus Daviesbacteria bacterium RIFCSPLOWO2_02_FULL_36_8]